MKKRNIRDANIIFSNDNKEVLESLEDPVALSVITKCPEKYLLIDREFGTVYRGSSTRSLHTVDTCIWEVVSS
jgi:hypothetical protein